MNQGNYLIEQSFLNFCLSQINFYEFYENSKLVLNNINNMSKEIFDNLNKKNLENYHISKKKLFTDTVLNKEKIFYSFFKIEFKKVNEENIFSLVNKKIMSNLRQNFFINKNLNQFIEEQLCDYIVENFALNNNMINYLMKKTQRQSEDLWLKNLDEQKELKKSFQKEKDILRAQIKNLKKDVQNLNKEMEMEKKRAKELEEINSKMKLEQEKREKEIISKMNLELEKREKEIISKMKLEQEKREKEIISAQEKREKEIFSKLNLEHEKKENAIRDKYEKIIDSMEDNYNKNNELEKLKKEKIVLAQRLKENIEVFKFYSKKISEIGIMKMTIDMLKLELNAKNNEILSLKAAFDIDII